MTTIRPTRTANGTATRDGLSTRTRTRALALLGALLLASAFLVVGGVASPASAAVTAQCNGLVNDGGRGLECEITVENFLNLATGAENSRVTTLACTGAANEDPLPSCVGPTVTEFAELTTESNQCNGSDNGGGSTMQCSLTVINTITGGATAEIAPINQCNGSLDTGDVRVCTPDPATADASIDGVTQCNGSVNGGGGSMTCAVTPATTSNSAFAFLANQCNNSANGGGETIVCTVDISTVILPADTDESPGSPETIAETGADTGFAMGLSALLVASGLAALVVTRRRASAGE